MFANLIYLFIKILSVPYRLSNQHAIHTSHTTRTRTTYTFNMNGTGTSILKVVIYNTTTREGKDSLMTSICFRMLSYNVFGEFIAAIIFLCCPNFYQFGRASSFRFFLFFDLLYICCLEVERIFLFISSFYIYFYFIHTIQCTLEKFIFTQVCIVFDI